MGNVLTTIATRNMTNMATTAAKAAAVTAGTFDMDRAAPVVQDARTAATRLVCARYRPPRQSVTGTA